MKQSNRPFGYLGRGLTIPRAMWHQDAKFRALSKALDRIPDGPTCERMARDGKEWNAHTGIWGRRAGKQEDWADVAAQIDEALGLIRMGGSNAAN